MILFKYKGVELDYCCDSQSLWVDAGELDKLMAESVSKRSTSLDSGLEGAVDVLGDFFEQLSFDAAFEVGKMVISSAGDVIDFIDIG